MKFSDVIGHESAKSGLRAMIDSDRVPHALLISGPAGVGALALARAAAQYMHCRNPQGGDSCGVCPACLQHRSLNNADMHYVYPVVKKKAEGKLLSADYASEWREFLSSGAYATWEDWLETSGAGNSQPMIYVEESAEIVRKMNMSNYSAKYKVTLIWLPERLQPEAANKLLKIIEEPFADTRFILVSNAPSEVLPTIYSRTQAVVLQRLSGVEIAQALERDYGVDPVMAAEVAELAQGSMSAAIEAIGTSGEKAEFASLFRNMMRQAYARDVKSLRGLGDTVAGMGREKSRRYLNYCNRMVRESFMYNLGVEALLHMDSEEMAFSSRFAPFINAANAELMMREFETASTDIAGNGSGKIIMFDMLLRLIVLLRMRP